MPNTRTIQRCHTREDLLRAWTTDSAFTCAPLTRVDLSTFRDAFLELLDLSTVSTALNDAHWSKRVARFSLFSEDYETHHERHHAEQSVLSADDLIANPFVSYLLRDELSTFIATGSLLPLLPVREGADSPSPVRLRESILLTGSAYRLPFHLDGCETLLVAITGSRTVSILTNFLDVFLQHPVRLHCRSYIPQEYEPRSSICEYHLAEGEGLLIPPLCPHSVAANGENTLAYTAYVDVPRIQAAPDIKDIDPSVGPCRI